MAAGPRRAGRVNLLRTEPTHLELSAGGANPAPPARAGAHANEPTLPGVDSFAPLVARARRGDRHAFAAIYRQHGPMVHAVLLARVPPADADDLTQEVFISAWRALPSLRDGDAVGGWLASIARRKAKDWARARLGRRERERRAARAERMPAPAPPPPGSPDAADVLACIRSLPEAYREPLVMRLVEGLRGPEIAAALGMTHGSVRVNLHKGMKLLRAKLAEIEP